MNREHKILSAISVIIAITALYYFSSYLNLITRQKFDIFLNWKFMVNILPTITALVGVIILVTTKFQQTAVLKIFMCYTVFVFPFSLVHFKFYLDNIGKFENNTFLNWPIVLSVSSTFLLMISCCVALRIFSKRLEPRLVNVILGGETFAEFSPAPASRRFVNRLVDIVIILYVGYAEIIDSYQFRSLLRGTGTGSLFIVEFLITLYYYLVLEAAFNTSIGKIITNTIIVDNSGKKAGFAKVLGRTLCRYIPLEGFSFLGKISRGWHDSIPDTYVVIAADKNHNREIEQEV